MAEILNDMADTLSRIENRKDLVTALNEAELDKLNNDLMEDIIETPYTTKRMMLIAEKYELDTQETQELTRIIKDYQVKPASIEKILGHGISINEVEPFVYLYKELNGGVLKL